MSKLKQVPLHEAFCFNCHQITPYWVRVERCDEIIPITRWKKVKAVFPRIVACCARCGDEVYVSSIHDRNMDVRWRAGLAVFEREAREVSNAERVSDPVE